ncbi:MAG: Ig-like domain-containing protein [Bacilli bacterium]|nr:Ig-like domain-containing protein [Bacilli bacterium]
MAKSDFDLDEQEYDVVLDEPKSKKKTKNSKKSSKTSSAADKAILDNLNSGNASNNASAELGDFSNNVVYDDEKTSIFDGLSSANLRTIIVMSGLLLVIFVAIFVIALSIVKAGNAYEAETIIPDIVYMGETSNIYVATKYTGNGKPKKNISETENEFESSDANTLYVLNDSVKGPAVLNTIIPVQEGRAKISIISKLDGKTIGKEEKEVVVCPAFDASMVHLKNISVVKGSKYNLEIDFGEKECVKGITYSSSDQNIATVSDDGVVEGIAVGNTVLTIRRGTKSASVTVNVTDSSVSLQSFNVAPLELRLSIGEKYRLKTDYSPITATNFVVNYYSYNSDIVSVSKGGLITALSVGTTTIKVSNTGLMGSTEIKVVVSDEASSDFATDMVLDRSEVKLVQGQSQKIDVTFTPNTISKDIVKWNSSNEEIATVTPSGVIYAKGVGNAVVTASTDNGISRDIAVNVIKIKSPTIVTSDGIKSDNWHTKPFVISFLGSDSGTVYYYGDSVTNMKNVGDKLTISASENKTYYVKACTRVCQEVCTPKKNAKDDDKDCKTVCSEEPSVCSDSVMYVSKLDNVKPSITTVVGIDEISSKTDTVQIAITDNASLVNRWCVTDRNSYGRCKWKAIEPSSNPVLEYAISKNGTYYAFARDVAGNISDGYEFKITNIG